MPDVLRKYLRLPARDRALLVRGVVTLFAARLAIWVLPFSWARGLFARRARRGPVDGFGQEQVRWAVTHATRVVPHATCLPQALAAASLLARAGHDAELHIGVKKNTKGKLEAHAWVESAGRIVVGDLPWGLEEYTRLPPLPGQKRA